METKEVYDIMANADVGPLEFVGACQTIVNNNGLVGKTKAQTLLGDIMANNKLNPEERVGFCLTVMTPLI